MVRTLLVILLCLPSMTWGTTGTFTSGSQSSNDIGMTTITFDTTQQYSLLGYSALVSHHKAGIRFENVTIPYNSTINNCSLKVFWGGTGAAVTIKVKMFGNDVDSAVAFTDETEFDARSSALTAESTMVTMGPHKADSIWTYGLTTSWLYEIVHRAGYKSGNSVALLIYNNGSIVGEEKSLTTNDWGNPPAASLIVNYTEPVSPIDTFISSRTTAAAFISDTWIRNSTTYNNRSYGTATSLGLYGGTSTSAGSILLRFNGIEDSIPEGVSITAAVCSLQLYTDGAGAQVTDVHRMFKLFEEGTGTGGTGDTSQGSSRLYWRMNPGIQDTSWGTAFATSARDDGTDNEGNGAGADRTLTPISSQSISGIGWKAFDITAAVENWYKGTWANNGIMIRSATAATALDYYYSSNNGTVARRPVVYVIYTNVAGEPSTTARRRVILGGN